MLSFFINTTAFETTPHGIKFRAKFIETWTPMCKQTPSNFIKRGFYPARQPGVD